MRFFCSLFFPVALAGILAFRVQSSLLYFNVEHVLDVVRQRIKSQPGPRRVICDLSNVPYADLAAARMLRRLHDDLAAAQIDFKIVEAHGPVRDILRAEGLESLVGAITRHHTLADAIAEPLEASPNPAVKSVSSG